ncbi:MAG: sulfurtransferase TusA family protein [Pseudomonadota bacterium]
MNVLDITQDSCPMTFVKTRVAFDKLKDAQTLVVRLVGEENLQSVTGGIAECGGEVLRIDTPEQALKPDLYEIHIKRKPQI